MGGNGTGKVCEKVTVFLGVGRSLVTEPTTSLKGNITTTTRGGRGTNSFATLVMIIIIIISLDTLLSSFQALL